MLRFFDSPIHRFTDSLTSEENTMRFMILLKADKDTESGVMPGEQLLVE